MTKKPITPAIGYPTGPAPPFPPEPGPRDPNAMTQSIDPESPEGKAWVDAMDHAIKWRPMSEFDPTQPAQVHDKLNDQVIEWEPGRHGRDYQVHGHHDLGDGVIAWDGLLLDGWRPAPSR